MTRAKASPHPLRGEARGLIHPGPPPTESGDEASLTSWGFQDTEFAVDSSGAITVTGDRYPGLSGERMPELLPWFRTVVGIDFPLADEAPLRTAPVPPSRAAPAFLDAIKSVVDADAVRTDEHIRQRHGHGHTVAEIEAVRGDGLPRVPDYVVYPDSEAQVTAIVQAARTHGVVLMPYGGGTNVSEALRCLTDEERPIVAVDMSRMSRILWIDPVNRMARIEAGAVGRHIQKQLAEYGFTMGHEPDSVEFSTLGGWIATNASGMKKNRYGNIEDMLLDVTVVTARGTLERSQVAPRESIGVDPKLWMIGSEGSLGVITSAVVKLFPLPEQRSYGSVLFKSFEDGVAFMYDLAQQDSYPASVRLVDNLQFQFGQVLKPARKGRRQLGRALEKWVVTALLGFDPGTMVAATLVFEGSKRDVARQEKTVYSVAKRHGGFKAGAENGKRGYRLTFGIAYIRDFVLKHHILAESFETSVPWSRAQELVTRVKASIHRAHREAGLPGHPFVSCRVTQIYETGCCIYFYMAFYTRGLEDPLGAYHQIETVARHEVLASGGSISHHHGVGKLRLPFLDQIMSPTMRQWRDDMKATLDPTGVFAAQRPWNNGDLETLIS